MSDANRFSLDGKPVEFQPGDTIMDAALRAGNYIPHLCHNPEFEPHGSCRICLRERALVGEIPGMRKSSW